MKPSRHVLQPVFSRSGGLILSEVLSRFDDEPDTQAMILRAEADGSIVEIDLAAIEFGVSCSSPVAINISPRTIETATEDVLRRLRPGITFEITETYPASLHALTKFAAEVHDRGGLIALDDLGCGAFADLDFVRGLIKEISPDWLKLPIDAGMPLLETCICTGIPVVMEKIETHADLLSVLDVGATGLQGWFFDFPPGKVWLAKMEAWLVESCSSFYYSAS